MGAGTLIPQFLVTRKLIEAVLILFKIAESFSAYS